MYMDYPYNLAETRMVCNHESDDRKDDVFVSVIRILKNIINYMIMFPLIQTSNFCNFQNCLLFWLTSAVTGCCCCCRAVTPCLLGQVDNVLLCSACDHRRRIQKMRRTKI